MDMPILQPVYTPVRYVSWTKTLPLWVKEFITTLVVLVQGHSANWELLEDWSLFGFTVPKGFITDLDSVPRIPYVYAYIRGRCRAACILHDFLYRTQPEGVDRAAADKLFLEGCKAEGVLLSFAYVYYWGVRLGAKRGWDKNAKALKAAA